MTRGYFFESFRQDFFEKHVGHVAFVQENESKSGYGVLSVKNCQYNVNNYKWQIVNLARTTLRNIIGTLTLKSANSERNRINADLLKTLAHETGRWGL